MNDRAETAKRPPFVYWTCLWGSGLAVALVATAYDIIRPDLGTPPGRDFSNLYTAGKLALEGRAYLAFDLDTFRLALRDFVGTLTLQNYSYPPHAMFIAVPFALLPYGISFAVWSVLSLGFFYWAAKPHVQFPPILSILTPAAALNVWNGHYGL
jgi:alpha-1,2-mannosyltransferase